MFIELQKFEIQIKGITWLVFGAPTQIYDEINAKRVGPRWQPGSSSGVCYKALREIGFDLGRDDVTLEKTVIHELTHAYLGSCCLNSTSVDIEDYEEVFCELMEEHMDDIRGQSNLLFKELKAERRRLKRLIRKSKGAKRG